MERTRLADPGSVGTKQPRREPEEQLPALGNSGRIDLFFQKSRPTIFQLCQLGACDVCGKQVLGNCL